MMAASAALSTGGAMISSNEAQANQERVANARNSVLSQTLDRQAQWGKEARGLFDTRMNDYQPATQGESLTKAQDARTADITKNVTAPTASDIPLSGSTPEVVKSEISKRMLATFQQAQDRAKAAGKVGGYGDNWLGNNMGVTDTARRVGTINNFSGNDAALLPARQEFAEVGARQPASIWGPILSAGGNIAAAGAGRGWNPFGGTAGASVPLPQPNPLRGI